MIWLILRKTGRMTLKQQSLAEGPRMKKKDDRTRIGRFSLVELLVVTAVVALLLTIMLPALRVARDKAKEIECSGQLRQIGIAMHLYVSDNQDWFPQDPVVPDAAICWDYQIAGYLNYKFVGSRAIWGPPIFNCPSGKVYRYAGESRGYAMNAVVGRNTAALNGRCGRLRDTGQMLVCEFYIKSWNNAQGWAIVARDGYEYAKNHVSSIDYLDWRHHGRMNYLKKDGSVGSDTRGAGLGKDMVWGVYP